MYYYGVDPGKTGCMCVFNKDDYEDIHFLDWPKDNQVSEYVKDIENTFNNYKPKLVVIEKVNAMPNQGVVSMFNFGMNYGIWQGILTTFKVPYRLIQPKQWRKGLVVNSDGDTTKVANYNVCSRLFPNADIKGPRGAIMSGRVDALLMAYYASTL